MFWRDEFPLDQFSKMGTNEYLYQFNVKKSFALHEGFMVFATKMFQEVQCLVLKNVKVNFPGRFIHVSENLSTV